VQFAPPPQPVVLQPTPVVPAPNNTGPTNVLAVPVEVEQRKRIAKSAKDEWDRWKVISAEGDRLTLRQQYFDTIPEPGRTEILKAVTSHNNSKTHWCGIFGAWNVRQVRNDGVGWSLAGRPTKVLLCYDVAKLHTGDIGIVADDPAVVKAWGDWKKLYDPQYAALKAANPTWPPDKLDQETRKLVPPAPKMPVNHHVLVTDASKDPVEVVQGNTGAAQGTPYASYSIVLDGTVERRKLGGFYCSVPDKTCMDKAIKTNNWQCPIRNGQPCVLPDK
jgi:hypothetical protein